MKPIRTFKNFLSGSTITSPILSHARLMIERFFANHAPWIRYVNTRAPSSAFPTLILLGLIS